MRSFIFTFGLGCKIEYYLKTMTARRFDCANFLKSTASLIILINRSKLNFPMKIQSFFLCSIESRNFLMRFITFVHDNIGGKWRIILLNSFCKKILVYSITIIIIRIISLPSNLGLPFFRGTLITVVGFIGTFITINVYQSTVQNYILFFL